MPLTVSDAAKRAVTSDGNGPTAASQPADLNGRCRPEADVRFCVRRQSSRWELPPYPHAVLDNGTHSVGIFLDSA